MKEKDNMPPKTGVNKFAPKHYDIESKKNVDLYYEEIKQAAKLAQCDEFIRTLPDGYNTMIVEIGERLSDDERQRISTARALLNDAPIILNDKAVTSLNVENETKIQAGISELIKRKPY